MPTKTWNFNMVLTYEADDEKDLPDIALLAARFQFEVERIVGSVPFKPDPDNQKLTFEWAVAVAEEPREL